MNEVLEFLKECKRFFVATTEDGKPKVRPFGFIMSHEDKLYFATGNQKPFFKQVNINPEIEICGVNQKMEWIRLSGKVVFDSRLEIKQKVFEVSPFLLNTYNTAEDPTMECFYIDEAKAEISKMNGTTDTIIL